MKSRDITPDHSRGERLGFDEAILCESKTVAQISAIIKHADACGQRLLLTRLEDAQYRALPTNYCERIDYEAISCTAYFGNIPQPTDKARVVVVTAGTSDVRTSREAVRTLRYYGVNYVEIYDVGVAGLWRLLDRVEEIRNFPIVIAVAGMDAALPSVLGGLVASVVIAVPTSNGYGVVAGGDTALRAALSSCAPGVVVVNIDNGYGAACAALRMLNAGL